MSGFFGFGAFQGGTIAGNLLAKGGQFGPIFIPTPAGGITFTIVAGANSNGPFVGLPNNSYEFAASSNTVSPPSGSTSGAINGDPILINGSTLVVAGQINSSPANVHYNVICLAGTHPQNFFTSWVFDDGAGNHYNLLTTAANFNAPWPVQPGFTFWTWVVPPAQAFAPLNQPMTVS